MNIDDKIFDENMSALFHSVVQKFLLITKRAHPNLQTAVSFLCTHVQSSNIADWNKLKNLLQFVHVTIDENLTLSVEIGLTFMTTWTNVSYDIHPDIRSHMGGCIILGQGIINCRSTKQKLNTKILTKADLVGASNYLPFLIWKQYFFNAQG